VTIPVKIDRYIDRFGADIFRYLDVSAIGRAGAARIARFRTVLAALVRRS
jgi:hypothetical protein